MALTFHLGLCMAGSVSAGAYTAGVVDYLLETLRNWEQAKAAGEAGLPIHQVEIDLLGGTSGGGITAALAFFGFRDAYTPSVLQADRRTYQVDPNNVFWNTWVKLSGDDMLVRLLDPSDINRGFVKSALNSGFIDELAMEVGRYVESLAAARKSEQIPAFLSSDMELYMTLFNVTGIKYLLLSKGFGSIKQYIAEHRDLAHFRYADAYRNDGRIEVSLNNLQNLNILLDAAKATGAFPGGLEARKVCRQAKHIWDNPFFQKNNKFNKDSINLGKDISVPEQQYCSLNADGGTSNNEPVELMQNLMVAIRNQEQPDEKLAGFDAMNDTEKKVVKSTLDNYTIVLIDPFPSYDFDIKVPEETDKNLRSYLLKLVAAMADQLRFDAKEAKDAYDKDNYGLYVVAPSRDGVQPEHALASGALGGFSGFLHAEYRIHDFFLGRHNCQSFLRKHFSVSLDEAHQSNASYHCIQAVLEGYRANPEAINRFAFEDVDGKMKVPIIPDVTLPLSTGNPAANGATQLSTAHDLPTYQMHLPHRDFLQQYHRHITRRVNRLLNNAVELNTIQDLVRRGVVNMYDDNLADKVIQIITQTLSERKLLR